MALWGNSDNIVSAGIVTLTKVGSDWIVSGEQHNAQFGQTVVGGAKTGDVIRFGVRGGGGVYFGDAVIVSIASSTRLTIGSTMGLSSVAIAGTDYYVSELPSYTVSDSTYSNLRDAAQALTSLSFVGTATTIAGAGTSCVPVNAIGENLQAGDYVVNGGSNIIISSIGSATGAATTNAGVGTSIINVIVPPGVVVGDKVTNNSILIPITAISGNQVSLGSTISVGISTNATITFTGNSLIGLGGTVLSGINTGDSVTFKRLMDGYDKQVYGISTSATAPAIYKNAVTHQGWVGIMTYTDCHGRLRVKSETLVAASGITTGANGIAYPTNK